MIEQKRKFPAPEVLERIAAVLKIEATELFIEPLSDPVEIDRVYQRIGKNIDYLICQSIERHYQATAKNLEQVISKSIEKAFSSKCKKRNNRT